MQKQPSHLKATRLFDKKPSDPRTVDLTEEVYSDLHQRKCVGYKQPKDMTARQNSKPGKGLQTVPEVAAEEELMAVDAPCVATTSTTARAVDGLEQQTVSQANRLRLKRRLAAQSKPVAQVELEDDDEDVSDLDENEVNHIEERYAHALPKRQRGKKRARLIGEREETEQEETQQFTILRPDQPMPWKNLKPASKDGRKPALGDDVKQWFGCIVGFYWLNKGLTHFNGTGYSPYKCAQDVYWCDAVPPELKMETNELIKWPSVVSADDQEEFKVAVEHFNPGPYYGAKDLYEYYKKNDFPKNFICYVNCISKYIETFKDVQPGLDVLSHDGMRQQFAAYLMEGRLDELTKMGFSYDIQFTGEATVTGVPTMQS